jgi:poly(hydroxyalkanoate) depolymerase family esterase
MIIRFPNLVARLRRLNPLREASDGSSQPTPSIDVARTIEDALAKAGLHRAEPAANEPGRPIHRARTGEDDRSVIDVEFRTVDPRENVSAPGQFLTRSYANAAGTRNYKLYVPASIGLRFAKPSGLLVMLHGCTQSPDDFAAGTRMNEQAEQLGMVVVYPQQTGRANTSQCWNWFRPQDQQRDGGEPSIIADLTRELAAQYGIDPAHTYVAGLSAGAAMAVILGQTYPDVFAAVGAHSGLAYGVARDVPSALGAMRGADLASLDGHVPASKHRTPTIVFHGDGDRTVALKNGTAIIDQLTRDELRDGTLRQHTHAGATQSGRSYTRQVYVDADATPVVEYWVLHGSGHAWSGGSADGSFTEPDGPDASSEMMRFFSAQRSR